jgi:hypothetical protein
MANLEKIDVNLKKEDLNIKFLNTANLYFLLRLIIFRTPATLAISVVWNIIVWSYIIYKYAYMKEEL